MFPQPHRLRVRLFIQLLLLANSNPLQIKDLIEQTSREKGVSTIAFFGNIYELEAVLSEVDASIPRMVYTESYGELYFSGIFNKDILVVACINLWQRSTLNRIDVAFREIHSASRSIYLVRENRYKNLRYLAGHFEWCWSKGFVNVLVHFTLTDETFFYTRFPEMRFFRGNPNESELFPNQFRNLMGYTIRTPLQHDPPRVFEYTDSWGRKHLTGYCADIFLAFLGAHNATLMIVRVNNSTAYNIPGIVKLIRAGLVDISIHPFMNFNGVRSSYPIRMMQWCILVPFRGEIRGYWYFIRPFQPYVWLSCLGALISISFCVSMDEYIRGQSYDFGQSCCNVFRSILNLPTADSRPFALNRALRTALVFMLGFMLCNLYLAYLTSFLAKVIFEPQIKTLQELVTNNISILTQDFEIPIILQNRGLPTGFKRLLIPSPTVDVRMLQKTQRNQSFAYTTTDDKASFILVQQVHLKQPLYKIVDESVSTIPLGFLMPQHSPFEGILNRYIQRINAAGLVYKWRSDMYASALRAGILKVLPSNTQQKQPLNVEHFQFAWIALGGGLGVAAVCAVLERVVRFLSRFRIVVVFR